MAKDPCVLLTKWLEATMLKQFCSQDLVTVILQFHIYGERKNVVGTSAYLPYDYLCPPSAQELSDLVAVSTFVRLRSAYLLGE